MGVSNLNLNKAKLVKNDEFYTQLEDIAKEMPYYKKHFKNAIVYCNCDDPKQSNFWRYFHINFKNLGLKKLISTHINLNGSNSYMMEYTGGNDSDVLDGTIIPLKGDGDFRSDECIELLNKSDVVVTNPPFSLFREYIDVCVKNKAKFLILGNLNSSSCKNIFSLFTSQKMWYGVSLRTGGLDFYTPKETCTHMKVKYTKGNYCFVNVCVRWFTNLEHGFVPEPLPLVKKYNAKDYPKYDNYDVIEVSRLKDIPCDYKEVMGVPITFLSKWNPSQFDVVGSTGYGTCNSIPCTSSRTKHAILNGKELYQRVFIKSKH